MTNKTALLIEPVNSPEYITSANLGNRMVIKQWVYAFSYFKERFGVKMNGLPSVPLGLAQLSAIIKRNGWNTVHIPIINIAFKKFLTDSAISKKVKAQKFNFVLLSCTSPEATEEVKRYARLIKSINPDAPILVGGVYPSMSPEIFMECEAIDYIIRGEGEVALEKLLNSLSSNEYDYIKGLCYRNKGELIISKEFAEIPDLNSIPPFDMDSMVLKDYMKFNSFINIQTARGCPYGCPFCLHSTFWGKDTRYRPIGHIMKEMKTLEDHGCSGGYIIDSSFTIDKERLLEFVEAYEKTGLKMPLAIETRADLFDEEAAKILKRINVFLVWFGGESGDPEVLKELSGKDKDDGTFHVDALFKATKICEEFDFISGTSWVAGLPGETPQSLKNTEKTIINLLKNGLIFADIRSLKIFSGTPYYENPEKWGLKINKAAAADGWHEASHSTKDLSSDDINRLTEEVRANIHKIYRKRSSLMFKASMLVEVLAFIFKVKNIFLSLIGREASSKFYSQK